LLASAQGLPAPPWFGTGRAEVGRIDGGTTAEHRGEPDHLRATLGLPRGRKQHRPAPLRNNPVDDPKGHADRSLGGPPSTNVHGCPEGPHDRRRRRTRVRARLNGPTRQGAAERAVRVSHHVRPHARTGSGPDLTKPDILRLAERAQRLASVGDGPVSGSGLPQALVSGSCPVLRGSDPERPKKGPTEGEVRGESGCSANGSGVDRRPDRMLDAPARLPP